MPIAFLSIADLMIVSHLLAYSKKIVAMDATVLIVIAFAP